MILLIICKKLGIIEDSETIHSMAKQAPASKIAGTEAKIEVSENNEIEEDTGNGSTGWCKIF